MRFISNKIFLLNAGLVFCLLGIGQISIADDYAGNLAKGAKTTKRNYMNDPFVRPAKANWLVLPETLPSNYNRGPLDRSPKDKSSKLLTMGTGTPAPNTYRFGPAMALIVNDYPYFIDCGEGWFRALNRSTITQK